MVIDGLNVLSDQKECLNGGKVIVIDNFSEDGSAHKIESAINNAGWSFWVEQLNMPRNGGFAYGNNAGIKYAIGGENKADYLVLLNPDTLVRPNAIEELIKFMEMHPNVGVAGSRLENVEGRIECSAHQFPSPVGELLESARLGFLTKFFAKFEVTPALRDVPHPCDWVSGSSMIIRRQVIEEIGYLDEEFFLYFEEVDFFQRIAKTKWQVWYVPSSVVMHIEGASTEIKVAKRRPSYWFESRRRYYVKHYGVLGLIAADALWTLGWLSYKLRRTLQLGTFGPLTEPPWLTFDILFGDVKALFSQKIWTIK